MVAFKCQCDTVANSSDTLGGMVGRVAVGRGVVSCSGLTPVRQGPDLEGFVAMGMATLQVVVGLALDAVAAHLAVEVRPVDPQPAGGLGHVPAGPLEFAYDE
jgi:hypothetical protein